MAATASLLAALVEKTHKPEAEVITMAVQAGLRQLWREGVLGQYLKGELTREEAASEVGIDLVELAERQREAAEEDLDWAFEGSADAGPLEGHQVLRSDIERVREESKERDDHLLFLLQTLNGKIDGVAIDLADHRRDTEAHGGVYRVKERS